MGLSVYPDEQERVSCLLCCLVRVWKGGSELDSGSSFTSICLRTPSLPLCAHFSQLEYGSSFSLACLATRSLLLLPTIVSKLENGSRSTLVYLTTPSLLPVSHSKCHRLRHEAALAQHKELEIGKQTRQALVENDALCRTVERLQKSFATHKVRYKNTGRHKKGTRYGKSATYMYVMILQVPQLRLLGSSV